MHKIRQHKTLVLWYNIFVPRENAERIFDIGLQTVESRSDLVPAVCETFGLGHSCASQNPRVGCARCVHRPRELRKRIRRLQNIRNISVLGFVAKPLTFHDEKPNTMVRRVIITRRAFSSCFSLRLLAAPATRRNIEGTPLFFSAPKRRHPVW